MKMADNAANAVGRSTIFAGLEAASQLHQHKIVIDFGVDRLRKWIVTYICTFLAIATVGRLQTGSALTCNPVNNSLSSGVIDFTNSYCWTTDTNTNEICQNRDSWKNATLVTDHQKIKTMFRNFQYIILFQVLLFTIPWAYWQFKEETNLVGHIKYMQDLLKQIFKLTKDIPCGYNEEEPYDINSDTFNGKRILEVDEAQIQPANYQISWWKKLIVGNMKDRNLFSMLCYENFASFEYLPHILTVYKTCHKESGNSNDYGHPMDMYKTDQCILYQWCHKDNFTNATLILSYLLKQIVFSVIGLVFLVITLVLVNVEDIWITIAGPNMFRCFVEFENNCVPCVINKTEEMSVLILADYLLLIVIIVLSVYQWVKVRFYSKNLWYYFEEIKRTFDALINVQQVLQNST